MRLARRNAGVTAACTLSIDEFTGTLTSDQFNVALDDLKDTFCAHLTTSRRLRELWAADTATLSKEEKVDKRKLRRVCFRSWVDRLPPLP